MSEKPKKEKFKYIGFRMIEHSSNSEDCKDDIVYTFENGHSQQYEICLKENNDEHVYFCYVDIEGKEIDGVPPEICDSGYDSIDKILSARFHNILNCGTAYNEVKYCIQDFENSAERDFEIHTFFYEGHFVSTLFQKPELKPIYVFDSQYIDSSGSASRNTQICQAIKGTEEGDGIEVKNLYDDGSIQGESNLCGIYTIMFCRLASEYPSLDKLIKDIQNDKEKFVSKLNSGIENLINLGLVNERLRKNNLTRFKNKCINKGPSCTSSIPNGLGGGGSWTKKIEQETQQQKQTSGLGLP